MIDTFKALIEYHLNYNLPKWLNHAEIKERRIVSKHELSLEEGLDENPYTKGFLVFENGDNLINRLKDDEIVVDREILPWTYLTTDESLIEYIQGTNGNSQATPKRSRESAYVLDKGNGRVTRVREFNNKILLNISYAHYLPTGFLAPGQEIDGPDGIGLKSRNAIRTALAYPGVRTYQIKATPFSNAGIGLVAEFGSDGLVRTVHFEHRPREDLPYVNPEFQVIAIYQEFGRDERGEKICVSRKILDLNKDKSEWF